MNNNGPISYSTSPAFARDEIVSRLEYVHDLLDKEHRHAGTHAARNNYQAVIRLELEALINDLNRAPYEAESTRDSGFDMPIPW